jgi:hypothetical protein
MLSKVNQLLRAHQSEISIMTPMMILATLEATVEKPAKTIRDCLLMSALFAP